MIHVACISLVISPGFLHVRHYRSVWRGSMHDIGAIEAAFDRANDLLGVAIDGAEILNLVSSFEAFGFLNPFAE